VLVLVAGCNQLFDLHETTRGSVDADPCAMDRDCDGVLDEIDNCPDLANPDQRDIDLDGIGDACDPCTYHAISTVNDDDSDTIPDADDDCPLHPDPGQASSDRGGVGEACDPDPATHDTLRCYIDFRDVHDLVLWNLGPTWAASGSYLSHFDASPPDFETMTLSGVSADVTRFALQTAGYPQVIGASAPAYGLGAGATATSPGVQCVAGMTAVFGDSVELRAADGSVLAQAPRPAFATGSPPLTYIELVVDRRSDPSSLRCTITAAGVTTQVTASVPSLLGPLPISVVSANVAGDFNAVAIIELGS
jgi:hypothetical protein